MAAGGTLTLAPGSGDYVFTSSDVWSGVKGTGTRGVVLTSAGATLSVSNLERITGGYSPTQDVISLATAGNTMTVSGLETLIGSSGNDRIVLVSSGTRGNTLMVESVETLIGTTNAADVITLSDIGNTMSVAYLNSIAGGSGKDVITFGADGAVGTTVAISNIETIVGSSGIDVIGTIAGKSNTVSLESIE